MKLSKRLNIAQLARILLITFLLSQSSAAIAQNNSSPWAIDTSIGFFSAYMLRGLRLYDGPSLQPSAKITYNTTSAGSFSGSVWSHFSGNIDHHDENFTEIDSTLLYSLSTDNLNFTMGNVWYSYPYDRPHIFFDTAEFVGSISANTVLSPTVTVFEDYRHFDSQYYELGMSHAINTKKLGEGSNLTPFVAFGFSSNNNELYDKNGLVHITFGAALSLKFDQLSIAPSINYTKKIDENTVNQFWTGFTISYSL